MLIQDNKLTLDFTKYGRTRAQKQHINSLLKQGDIIQAIRYVQSFNGKDTERCRVYRPSRSGYDKLTNKGQGSVLKMFEKLKRLDTDYSPSTKSNGWIGVEIECMISESLLKKHSGYKGDFSCNECNGSGYVPEYDDDGDEIDSNECSECDGHEHSYATIRDCFRKILPVGTTRVTLKTDGSIKSEDGMIPIEFTVLTKYDDPKALKGLCEALEKVGAKVNSSCGLHVHFDVRDLEKHELVLIESNFKNALPVLAGVVPSSRRHNSYCQLKSSWSDRYSAINMTAVEKYGTIEIRLHSGSTNFTKIYNWIKLLHAIKTAKSVKKSKNINELEMSIKISEDLLEYFTNREVLFSDIANPLEVVSETMQDTDDTEQIYQLGA